MKKNKSSTTAVNSKWSCWNGRRSMLDMQSEGQPIDLETLEMIHKTKTGALLTFAVTSAAYC